MRWCPHAFKLNKKKTVCGLKLLALRTHMPPACLFPSNHIRNNCLYSFTPAKLLAIAEQLSLLRRTPSAPSRRLFLIILLQQCLQAYAFLFATMYFVHILSFVLCQYFLPCCGISVCTLVFRFSNSCCCHFSYLFCFGVFFYSAFYFLSSANN